MKILLIKPPIRACRIEIGRHIPVGLAYLASSLRAEGHIVTIFDALSFTEDNHIVSPMEYTETDRIKIRRHPRWKHLIHWGASWSRLEDAIRQTRPDVVGISCMFTPFYESAYETARLAKRLAPTALTIFGGQHPTVAYQHAIQERAFDLIVRGEGERTLVAVLEAYERGESLEGVPGLTFFCRPGFCSCQPGVKKVHLSPPAPQINDLDELPMPTTDLIDFSRYDHSTTLITSRGCPFSCTFCTVHATVGKKFRARSPHLVIEEMRHYVEQHNIRQFRIEDDNFTFDSARVHEICSEIKKSKLDVEIFLPNGITVVHLTEGLVRDMVEAGFKGLFLGLETTDQADLRRLRKGFTSIGKVREAAAWFDQAGVAVSASLIVGLLDHTIGSIAVDATRLTVAGIPYGSNPFYPIPGSTDYNTCLKKQVINLDTELALFDGFNFAIGSDVLSPGELYWSWVYAQALSFWPGFMRRTMTGPGRPEEIDIPVALDELVRIQRSQGMRSDRFETLASPSAAAGRLVEMSKDGCFCRRQQVRELRHGGGPLDFCAVTGDLMAAAVGLYCRAPMNAVQVESAVRSPLRSCAFRIEAGAPNEAVRVFNEFERSLREVAGSSCGAGVAASLEPGRVADQPQAADS